MTEVYSFNGLRVSELGVTNDLIYKIISFYFHNHPTLCDVYVNHAFDEKTRGADIELEIYNGSGIGYRYFIQAKKMDGNGMYTDIKKWAHWNTPQFQKLIDWADSKSGMPLYLLYNGSTPHSTLGDPMYGLSILDANLIRDYRHDQFFKKINKGVGHFSFDFLFPMGMDPFHVLFCGSSTLNHYHSIRINIKDSFIDEPYSKILVKGNARDDKMKLNIEKRKQYSDFPLYKVIIRDSEAIVENH